MAVMLILGSIYPFYVVSCVFMSKLRLESEKDIVSHKTLDPARKIDPENVLGNKVLNFSSFSRCLSDVRFV